MARTDWTDATGRALGKDLVHRRPRNPDHPAYAAVVQCFGYESMPARFRYQLFNLDRAVFTSFLLAAARFPASLLYAFRRSWPPSPSGNIFKSATSDGVF